MPPEGCTNEAVKELVRRVNEAADALEDWEEKAGGAAQQRRRRQLVASAASARGTAAVQVGRRQEIVIGQRPVPRLVER